ncbi:MAG: orotate phosphoribosyltransferase [Bacteroidales bacterium]|nr:orotate phosphoribosyltransferase [Bacteroidales bacterium]
MESTDRKLAARLLGIGAVLLRPEEPFTWASGWRSPIYCDNRRILSDPQTRAFVAGELAMKASELYPEAGIVAGVATGAIAHGVLAADRMGKPFVYVRPKPKDHGTKSQIEGNLPAGSKVVVIEDLVSTGMSSLAAVEALREAGADVLGMVAIFTYGFDIAAERFKEAGVRLDTLSDYGSLIEEATAEGLVGPAEAETLGKWRLNPAEWNR